MSDIFSRENPEEIFELVSKEASGNFGTVFKARNKKNAEIQAVKIIPLDLEDKNCLKDLEEEITVLQKFDTPYVTQYYSSYVHADKLWIALEYCDCGSIKGYMRELNQSLTEPQIRSVIYQTVLALQYIHSRSIIHRDVKSSNILFNTHGIAKLADFGVSLDQKETVRRSAIGSPYWMAPELILHQKYGQQVDIWSLGVTAIEMFESVPPLYQHKPMSAMFIIASGEAPPYEPTKPISPEFEDFIRSCLQRDQTLRPSSAQLLSNPFFHGVNDIEVKSMAHLIAYHRQRNGLNPSVEPEDERTISNTENSRDLSSDFLKLAKRKLSEINYIQSFANVNETSETNALLTDIAEKMIHPVYGLYRYDPATSEDIISSEPFFYGYQVIDWLYVNFDFPNREHTKKIASLLLYAGIVVSVKEKHPTFQDSLVMYCFDESVFYRFKAKYPLSKCVSRVFLPDRQKAEELTDRDWQLLLSGATPIVYLRGDFIVKEGSPNKFLYRIKSGKVKVEKGGKFLCFMQTNQVFGEMSLLDRRGKASANVIAEDDGVSVWVIDLSFIITMFKNEPGLCSRFYKQLSLKLADRLLSLPLPSQQQQHQQQHQQNKNQELRNSTTSSSQATSSMMNNSLASSSSLSSSLDVSFVSPRKTSSNFGESRDLSIDTSVSSPVLGTNERDLASHTDSNFQEKFTLPVTEILVREYSCTLKTKLLSQHGTLYISQQYVCFESKVFGYTRKERLPFKYIESVDKFRSNIVIVCSKKKYVLKGIEFVDDALEILKSIWRKNLDKKVLSRRARPSQQLTTESRVKRNQVYEADILTESDWKLILDSYAGIWSVEYQPGEMILEEQVRSRRIFQISRGTCRIVKKYSTGGTSTEGATLGTMQTGEIFGEISFLAGSLTSASIIAGPQGAEIIAIEGYYMDLLFLRQPCISGKLYHYFCHVLSSRLQDREAILYS